LEKETYWIVIPPWIVLRNKCGIFE
jgi:hypothetical protein